VGKEKEHAAALTEVLALGETTGPGFGRLRQFQPKRFAVDEH
jgi:hypothetical protein